MRAPALALLVLIPACSYPRLEDAGPGTPEPSDAATSADGSDAAIDLDPCADTTELSTPFLGGTAQQPDIAMAANGDATVVWTEAVTENAIRYTAATGEWGTHELIGGTPGVRGIRVAMNDGGDAFAVWANEVHTRIEVIRSSLDRAHWSHLEELAFEVDGLSAPVVVVDGAGNALVTWTVVASDRRDVWARRFVAATAIWEPAVPIGSEAATAPSGPAIGLAPDGDVTVVWLEETAPDTNRIAANRLDAATGAWTGAAQIDGPEGTIKELDLAVGPTGDAAAVWNQDRSILASRYLAGEQRWLPAEPLDGRGGHSAAPAVALTEEGEAIAVWWQSAGTMSNLWANQTEHGAWQGAGLIAPTYVESLAVARLAIDGRGQLAALWAQYGSFGPFIQYIEHTTEDGWSAPMAPAPLGLSLSAYDPRIAAGASSAMAVWQVAIAQGSIICAAPLWSVPSTDSTFR